MRSFRQPLVQAALLACALGVAGVASAQEAVPPLATENDAGPITFGAQTDYFQQEGGIQLATMLQQPGGQPSLSAAAPQSRRAATGGRQSGNRLASVPNMFGDLALASTTSTLLVQDTSNQFPFRTAFGSAEIPLGGGTRSGKLAENDIALPTDRVFFSYNHFHNVFTVREQEIALGAPPIPIGPPRVVQKSIDRYTIGAEKTFADGWASLEVRMPFNGTFDTKFNTLGVEGGNVGNLAAILKGLLYQDEALGIGVGLAVEAPTATDIDSRQGPLNVRFANEAVHLLPFIGFLSAPGDPSWGWSDGLFMSGFAQIDIAANGNQVELRGPGGGLIADLGKLNEQNLLFLDLAMGYWLYRNPEARVTGLAVISELHYTTTVQDADVIPYAFGPITIPVPGPVPTPATLAGAGVVGNIQNRFDIVNATIAVQTLFYDTSSLRVAGVFPLGSREDQRFFDSEIQVQFNRRF